MKKALSIILLVILVALSGCTNSIKNDETLDIVTSFYPIYIATANIVDGAEGVTLTNLTSTSVGCLHDYQLTTANLMTIEKADVLVINGGGMENFIQKVMDSCSNLTLIDSSKGIIEEHEEEHEHEEDHDEEHHHGENAHIWVSISLYEKQVQNICDMLCEADSNNEELYRKNTQDYILKLESLKKEMHETLDDISEENKRIVTFHEAFEFFAEEFGLTVVGVVEREPGTQPSAGELAEIIDTVKEMNAKAIFVEPQYSKTAADTISNETNIPIYTLDPVVSGELEKDAYEKIMKDNLNNLKEALED